MVKLKTASVSCVSAALLAAASPAIAGDKRKVAGMASAQATAERMVAGCAEFARKNGYPPLSIGVVDATGALLAFTRQDGASPATADVALLKARTALKANAPTAALAQVAAADGPTRDTLLALQLTTLPGGAPFAGGALGVSGGDADQDVACLQRAIDASNK